MKIDRKKKAYRIICPKCNQLRCVTYAQYINLKNNKNKSCQKCANIPKLEKFKFKKGNIPWNKGIKGYGKGHPPRFIAYGKNNPSWKGGLTSLNMKIRNSVEYDLWRKSVFERDKYTCIWCGQKGGKLCADHIKPFSLFPELRFSIDNGRTLCFECHKTTNTYLSKVKKYVI